jgi:agmatinase
MSQREFVPWYSGSVSFYRAPEVSIGSLADGTIAVLGVPIDSWILGRNGQRYGPRAIREASLYLAGYYGLQMQPGYLNVHTGLVSTIPDRPRIFDVGDVPIFQTDVQAQTTAIVDMVASIAERGATPVLLGGDHYVAYPGFEGFAKGIRTRHGDVKVGYLHIDSHADFWDELRNMGRFNHGTCTRRISENPMVKQMVWWGLNGGNIVEPNQFDEMERRGFVGYTVPSIRRRSPADAMREALERVSDGVDHVYVSCDIDVIDGAYAPGTHSIVTMGLTGEEYLDAMSVLSEFPTVKALDICETLPQYDSGGGRTARLGALGILSAFGPRIFDLEARYSLDRLAKVFI